MIHGTMRVALALATAATVLAAGCSRRSEAGTDASADFAADPGSAAQAGTAWGPLSWGMTDEEVTGALGDGQRSVGSLRSLHAWGVGESDPDLQVTEQAWSDHSFERDGWRGSAGVSPLVGLFEVQLEREDFVSEEKRDRALREACGMPEEGVRETRDEAARIWRFGPTVVALQRLARYRETTRKTRTDVVEVWLRVDRPVGPPPAWLPQPEDDPAADASPHADGVSGWIDLPWGASLEAARAAIAATGCDVEPEEREVSASLCRPPFEVRTLDLPGEPTDRTVRELRFPLGDRWATLVFAEDRGLVRADIHQLPIEPADAQAWMGRVEDLLGPAKRAIDSRNLAWSTPTTRVSLAMADDLRVRCTYRPSEEQPVGSEAGP